MFNRIFTVCFLFLVAPWASAGDISYDYIQLSYSEVDFEEVGFDGNQFTISGSTSLSTNVFLEAEFTDLSADFDIDGDALSFGGGFHAPISSKVDFLFSGGLIRGEVSNPFVGDEDDTGHYLVAGIASRLNNSLLLDLRADRTDLFDDAETAISLQLLVQASSVIDIGVGVGRTDDVDTMGAGIRANF